MIGRHLSRPQGTERRWPVFDVPKEGPPEPLDHSQQRRWQLHRAHGEGVEGVKYSIEQDNSAASREKDSGPAREVLIPWQGDSNVVASILGG